MSRYQKFQEKMKNIPINSGYSSKDVVALEYIQLLEEVLEEFKRLEDIVMEDIEEALYPENDEEEPLLGYYDADLNMFGLSKEE